MINVNGYDDNHLKQVMSINSINSASSQSSYKLFINNLTKSSFPSPVKSKFNFDSEAYNNSNYHHHHNNSNSSYNKVYSNYNSTKEKSFKRFSSLLSLNNETPSSKLTHQRKSSLSLNLGFNNKSKSKKLTISNPIINNLTKEKLRNKLKNSNIIYSIPIVENTNSINEIFKFCNNKKIMNLDRYLDSKENYNYKEIINNAAKKSDKDAVDLGENTESSKEKSSSKEQLEIDENTFLEMKDNIPVNFIKIIPFDNDPIDIAKIIKILLKNEKISNIPGLVHFNKINIIKNDIDIIPTSTSNVTSTKLSSTPQSKNNKLNFNSSKRFSIIMSTKYIGEKLTDYKFKNWFQICKIFWKICFILNMSEILIEFEHRNLIFDNIYLRPSSKKKLTLVSKDNHSQTATEDDSIDDEIDIDISIASFENSRFKVNNVIYAQNFSNLKVTNESDNSIMEILNQLNPNKFSIRSKSNLLWIKYIIEKLVLSEFENASFDSVIDLSESDQKNSDHLNFDKNFENLIKTKNYLSENMNKLTKISEFLRWANSQALMI